MRAKPGLSNPPFIDEADGPFSSPFSTSPSMLLVHLTALQLTAPATKHTLDSGLSLAVHLRSICSPTIYRRALASLYAHAHFDFGVPACRFCFVLEGCTGIFTLVLQRSVQRPSPMRRRHADFGSENLNLGAGRTDHTAKGPLVSLLS